MGFKECVASAIKAAGCEGEVINNSGKARLYMSIQPVFTNGADSASETGIGDDTRYKLYAAIDGNTLISHGDRIVCGEGVFEALKSETVYIGGEAVYIKALLCRVREQEADG